MEIKDLSGKQVADLTLRTRTIGNQQILCFLGKNSNTSAFSLPFFLRVHNSQQVLYALVQLIRLCF